jgi:hypothetical protein
MDLPRAAPRARLARWADRRVPETAYVKLLVLLGDVTPVVQPLPPAAALADVGGSITYWDRTPYDLAQRITGPRPRQTRPARADRRRRHLGSRRDGLRPPRPRR